MRPVILLDDVSKSTYWPSQLIEFELKAFNMHVLVEVLTTIFEMIAGRRHSIAGGQSIRSHHGMGSPDYSTSPRENPMTLEFQNVFINAGKIDESKRNISQKKRSNSFSDISRKFDSSHAANKSTSSQKVIREASGQRAKISAPSFTDSRTKSAVNDKSIKLNERPLLVDNVLDSEDKEQANYPVKPETAGSIMIISGMFHFTEHCFCNIFDWRCPYQ